MKKNILHKKLSKSTLEQLPPVVLMAKEIEEEKVLTRLARSDFHQSKKYACTRFHKPISKIVIPVA